MQENLLRCNFYIFFDTYCLLSLVFYHIVVVLVPAVLIPAAADVSDKHFPLVGAQEEPAKPCISERRTSVREAR